MQEVIKALKEDDAHIVEVTRADVRHWIDGDTNNLDEELTTALDNAQSEADEEGKTVYVVIQVRGAPL